MRLKYQVNTEFKLTNGKPILINITINSTKSACTTLPIRTGYTLLKLYRILPTLKEANQYIKYLKKIYKTSKFPPVVLDSGQKNLF